MFLPLFKIATDTIDSNAEFPLQLVGATAAGAFARKIHKVELHLELDKDELLDFNIGEPLVMKQLFKMLKPIN